MISRYASSYAVRPETTQVSVSITRWSGLQSAGLEYFCFSVGTYDNNLDVVFCCTILTKRPAISRRQRLDKRWSLFHLPLTSELTLGLVERLTLA